MATNKIIGFRAYHHDTDCYLHFDAVTGRNFLAVTKPDPISRPDAHRRIAAWLEQGDENFDDFSVDPVFHEPTPMEKTTSELTDLLQTLCNRNGLKLGLTREQIEAKLAEELVQFGASPVVDQINRLR